MGGPSIRVTGNSSGRPHRWMVTGSRELDLQNPAYRLTHCHPQALLIIARERRRPYPFKFFELQRVFQREQPSVELQPTRGPSDSYRYTVPQIGTKSTRNIDVVYASLVQVGLVGSKSSTFVSAQAELLGIHEKGEFSNCFFAHIFTMPYAEPVVALEPDSSQGSPAYYGKSP